MYQKTYVKVLAEFSEFGGLMPKKLVWEDGMNYLIDRVISVCDAPAKSGGFLTRRYACLFGDKERYLYYEKSKERWFVEICGEKE